MKIIKALKLNSVLYFYSLIIIGCITAIIVCTRIDQQTLIFFTSCQGSGYVEHRIFFILIIIQILLIICDWHKPTRTRSRYIQCPDDSTYENGVYEDGVSTENMWKLSEKLKKEENKYISPFRSTMKSESIYTSSSTHPTAHTQQTYKNDISHTPHTYKNELSHTPHTYTNGISHTYTNDISHTPHTYKNDTSQTYKNEIYDDMENSNSSIININNTNSINNIHHSHSNKHISNNYQSDLHNKFTDKNIQIEYKHNHTTPLNFSGFLERHSNEDEDAYTGVSTPLPLNYVPIELLGIDWNTMWMTTICVIFFFGFHASLMGWRIYSDILLYPSTAETCVHIISKIDRFTTRYSYSPFSESSFIELYAAFMTMFLIVRKFRDPFKITSYFVLYDTRNNLAGVTLFYFLQALLQIAILIYSFVNVALCWLFGYATPMQITYGVFLNMLCVAIFSTLAHVLQTDQHPRKFTNTLEFHWLWMISAIFIIWSCGIIFFISVYGPDWDNYFTPHISTWLLLLCITYYKYNSVFLPVKN